MGFMGDTAKEFRTVGGLDKPSDPELDDTPVEEQEPDFDGASEDDVAAEQEEADKADEAKAAQSEEKKPAKKTAKKTAAKKK
jgi:hypothetical protein